MNRLVQLLANQLEISYGALADHLEANDLKLVAVERDRGDGRMAHYGSGRQPIDDIIDAGWGGAFCAGNVLKYLRRDKERESSVAKAKWYWNKLHQIDALTELIKLDGMLTKEEKEMLK